MGCNCKEKKGFPLAMSKAKAYEAKSGKTAAIFVVKNVKGDKEVVSFTDKRNIRKVKDICCYYTTDGKEHEIKSRKQKEKAK